MRAVESLFTRNADRPFEPDLGLAFLTFCDLMLLAGCDQLFVMAVWALSFKCLQGCMRGGNKMDDHDSPRER